MRKIITAAAVTGLIAAGAITASLTAHADTPPAGTSATLAVSGGDLSITTQSDASFSSVAAGQTSAGGQLGTVTVTDMRAQLDGTWTASATSSDFTSSVTGAAAIPVTDITYAPGATSNTSGNASFTPGTAAGTDGTTPAVMSTDTGVTAYTTADEIGIASVSWDPTIHIALPSDAVAGTYSGTITHSVG